MLSKRKLIQLVMEGHVQGWDDPRMPTLCGIRRRGYPASALKLFCERVGISKAENNIDISVLEDCAREILDEEVIFIVICNRFKYNYDQVFVYRRLAHWQSWNH